jgi:acetyl-CoA synthetase
VAIVMPQCFDTAVAYMAVLQMGAVAMPLSLLFGPDALEYRLRDSAAVLAVCDASAWVSLQTARAQCPALRGVLGAGDFVLASGHGDQALDTAIAAQDSRFVPVPTRAADPAVLIYTSGTTGNPKGALIAHRALIGNLPGFVASQNGFGQAAESALAALSADPLPTAPAVQSVFWSPADWAWTGGLMDALLPTLYFGNTIIAQSARFSPQSALQLMGQCAVTHTFLFPTALKAMMKAFPGTPEQSVRDAFGLKLQALMSAGEAVGDAVFGYCEQQLGVQPNEMFGQTEINYIVGNCVALWPAKPGSMGMGYPGHLVKVIDEQGTECPVGVPGDVAVHRCDVHGDPDPVFFLGYWNNDAATAAKFTGDWCRTGDLAVRDADGYLWFMQATPKLRIGPAFLLPQASRSSARDFQTGQLQTSGSDRSVKVGNVVTIHQSVRLRLTRGGIRFPFSVAVIGMPQKVSSSLSCSERHLVNITKAYLLSIDATAARSKSTGTYCSQ